MTPRTKAAALVAAAVLMITLNACASTNNPPDDPTTPQTSQTSQTSDSPGSSATPGPAKDPITDLPDPGSVEALWGLLNGYWTSTDNLFVAFFWQPDQAQVTYGLWESECCETGMLKTAQSTGPKTATLTILIPARPESDMRDARPEMTVNATVDITDLDKDKKVKLTIQDFGSGEEHTYVYAGQTAAEAYESVH